MKIDFFNSKIDNGFIKYIILSDWYKYIDKNIFKKYLKVFLM